LVSIRQRVNGSDRVGKALDTRCHVWVKLCSGKEEFCLTKLQALRATSLTFAPLHLINVLNAFGLFARADRDQR
jgi:hypothetical protein